MNPASEQARSLLPRTKKNGLVVLLIAALIFVYGAWNAYSAPGPSRRTERARMEQRRILYVCPDKDVLVLDDLKKLASSYEIKRDEKPVVEGIFRLNEDCHEKPAEKIDVRKPACAKMKARLNCRTGLLTIPLR